MKCAKLIGFDDRWLMALGIPAMGFLFPLVFFGQNLGGGLAAYLPTWFFSTGFVTAIWFLCRALWVGFFEKFPDDERRRLMVSIPVLLVAPALFSVFLHWVLGKAGAPCPFSTSNFQEVVSSLFGTVMVVGNYEAAHFFSRFRSAEIENERLRRATMQAQLDGLRQQVNPHFLFNSLNTLAALIPEDTPRAVKFVEKMAKVYRYLLDLGEGELVEFREEIAFTENYVYLLKERFGENILISLDIPEELRGHRLPPLTLQILVENAVKHNVISAARPLKIEVFAEKSGRVVVKNNLQTKARLPNSPGKGLENVQARYAFFTDKKVDVLETADEFIVLFPLVEAMKLSEKPVAR